MSGVSVSHTHTDNTHTTLSRLVHLSPEVERSQQCHLAFSSSSCRPSLILDQWTNSFPTESTLLHSHKGTVHSLSPSSLAMVIQLSCWQSNLLLLPSFLVSSPHLLPLVKRQRRENIRCTFCSSNSLLRKESCDLRVKPYLSATTIRWIIDYLPDFLSKCNRMRHQVTSINCFWFRVHFFTTFRILSALLPFSLGLCDAGSAESASSTWKCH